MLEYDLGYMYNFVKSQDKLTWIPSIHQFPSIIVSFLSVAAPFHSRQTHEQVSAGAPAAVAEPVTDSAPEHQVPEEVYSAECIRHYVMAIPESNYTLHLVHSI